MAGKALHILNATAQLDTHRDRLAEAAIVVCALSTDVAFARTKIGDGPMLIGSFSPGKLWMGSQANPVWARYRSLLLDTVYPSSLKDPRDPTPHLLVDPRHLAHAERLASFLMNHVAASGLSGLYADDSWREKPDRILAVESAATGDDPQLLQARWQAYLHVLFSMLEAAGIPVWSNCAGDPPHPSVALSCEAPRPTIPTKVPPKRMAELVLGRDVGAGNHILWYGKCAVEGLFLEGETL